MKAFRRKLWKTLICSAAIAVHFFQAPITYDSEAAMAYAEDQTLLVEVSSDVSERAETNVLMVEILRNEIAASEKRILIYHTHTYEAYEQNPQNQYAAIEKWRTADPEHNVIAVGNALTASLTALGFQVVHDTTAFEPPTLDDAYSRSLEMLEKRTARGEAYDLYIDLHRDAIASTSSIKRTVNIGGEEVARFMVLVGKGTTGGYAEKPDWETNLALAQRISESLNDQCSGLARDVKIKTGRFNQHIAKACVLIECGTNWNTLDEVLAGVPYLAQSIFDAMEKTETPTD